MFRSVSLHLRWASVVVVLAEVTAILGCQRFEYHASSSAPLASATPINSTARPPTRAPIVPVATPLAGADSGVLNVQLGPVAKYSVRYTDFYYVHLYMLPGAVAIAISTASSGPVRILLVTRQQCLELPRTAYQLPDTGAVDLNKDREIFGWVKPPCCADERGRLGVESLLHVVSNRGRESLEVLFDKRGYIRPFMSTAEIFSFRDGTWQRSPIGRKRFQSVESVYTINDDIWLTESISNSWSVLQVRQGAVTSKISAPSLPNVVKKTDIERRGLDLTIFPDMSAISWGYLQDGHLLLDRWDDLTKGHGVARSVDDIALTIDQMNDLRNERVRNDTFTPWLQFEFRSANDVVIARNAQKRLRVTYSAASRSWTTGEEPSLTTQEQVAELLHLNVQPSERTDSVKVLGDKWVAVRRRDAERVIEVFTNDESLARCATITEEPYVYNPSGSNRPFPDAGM